VKRDHPKGKRSVKWIGEILLSFNLALALMLARSWDIFPLLERTKYFFEGHWGLTNYAAGVPAFYSLVLICSACLFVFFQFIAHILTAQQVSLLGGITAVGAIPACRFYPTIASYVRTGYFAFDGGQVLLFLELVVAVASVSVYVRRPYSITRLMAILFLGTHYGLWAWIYWRSGSSDPLLLVFPLVGFLSSLSWTFCCHSTARHHAVTAG
jgi:hypothetical protein